ncbi:MAG: DMT family transporter [Nitriliruptoraceae bacterium]
MTDLGPGVDRTRASGFPLVALAAALWGTDALFRRGLALELPATTVVVWEHLILVVILLPVIVRIPWGRLTLADRWSLLLIGAGASAFATILFTMSFRHGDPNTPLLLQKLQPVIAIVGARLLLSERLRPRFGMYAACAVGAAWLITFPDPFDVQPSHLTAGLQAAGAAGLWAMGTVLGRRMTPVLTFVQLTAARVAIGLPAALLFVVFVPGRQATVVEHLRVDLGDLRALLLLALVPGLAALLLYYRGLRATPASAATIAELAFPVAALTVNYEAFGATLTGSQSLGVLVLSATLVVMSLRSTRSASELGVDVSRGPRGN